MRFSFNARLVAEVAATVDAELRHWIGWLSARPGYVLGHNPRTMYSLEHDLSALLNNLNRLQLVAFQDGELSDTADQYCTLYDQICRSLLLTRSQQTQWRGSPQLAQQLLIELTEAHHQLSKFCVMITGAEPPVVDSRKTRETEAPTAHHLTGSSLLTTT